MDIYGIKIGERDIEKSLMYFNEGFNSKVTIYYYLWCIISDNEINLIDTGFSPVHCKVRNVRDYVSPVDSLKEIGVDSSDISNVLITHLHWDHFGGYTYYPKATFYVHKREWEFATGKFRNTKVIRDFYEKNVLEASKKLLNNGQLKLVEGYFQLNSSIHIVPIGGHTPGSQVICVNVDGNPLLFCGDLGYFYKNFEDKNPPMINLNIPESLEAYSKLEEIVNSEKGVIIPGHDPKLLNMYERVSRNIIRIA